MLNKSKSRSIQRNSIRDISNYWKLFWWYWYEFHWMLRIQTGLKLLKLLKFNSLWNTVWFHFKTKQLYRSVWVVFHKALIECVKLFGSSECLFPSPPRTINNNKHIITIFITLNWPQMKFGYEGEIGYVCYTHKWNRTRNIANILLKLIAHYAYVISSSR